MALNCRQDSKDSDSWRLALSNKYCRHLLHFRSLPNLKSLWLVRASVQYIIITTLLGEILRKHIVIHHTSPTINGLPPKHRPTIGLWRFFWRTKLWSTTGLMWRPFASYVQTWSGFPFPGHDCYYESAWWWWSIRHILHLATELKCGRTRMKPCPKVLPPPVGKPSRMRLRASSWKFGLQLVDVARGSHCQMTFHASWWRPTDEVSLIAWFSSPLFAKFAPWS